MLMAHDSFSTPSPHKYWFHLQLSHQSLILSPTMFYLSV